MSESSADHAPSKLLPLLEAGRQRPLLRELESVPPAQRAAGPPGDSLLEWAKGAAKTDTIPETTYTLYRRFRVAGERPPYERPYFKKRSLLTQEAVAAWLEADIAPGDDSRIDRINDLIWSICEETTWVLPAHERTEWTIDLFAAETGAHLAYVLLLLGDRLPEEVRDRVRAEVKGRIFDPYLEYGRQYWWDAGRNNWTGVCAGSVGEAFLLLEDDIARQAEALSLVLEQLERFISRAFEEDGGCLEGIGYWNYGLIHFVAFAEMMRERTGGAVDLLADEKIKAIARYPLAVMLDEHTYASFADSHEGSSLVPFLAARLAERTGATALKALTGGSSRWNLGTTLRDLLWWDGTRAELPPLEDVLLPHSGIARLVGESAGQPLALVVKAGHNGEPHNQNDVGSFVLRIGGATYLCDPGAGLYNADYFGAKRYENIFANSYGHSVPRIGGALQSPGSKRRGTMEKAGEKTVRIQFNEAYEAPALREAVRTISLEGGKVILEDFFGFAGTGLEVEEAFITWHKVETEGNVARVVTDEGMLEIRADAGAFAAERLEEACKANHKSGVLTRISIAYPPAEETVARFTMAYRPGN